MNCWPRRGEMARICWASCSISNSPGSSAAMPPVDSCPLNGSGNVKFARNVQAPRHRRITSEGQDPGPFPGQPVPGRGQRGARAGSARERQRGARVDQEGDLGPHRRGRGQRLQAVLRRVVGPEVADPGAQGRRQGRAGSAAGHRPRSRRRVHQLAPARGAQAEGLGQADRLPRDHRGGGARRDRSRPATST